MRLSNKLIEDVVSQVAGNDVLPLVQALKNKKNVSEFKLALDINHEINITRNMLYRLYHANLVSFIRRKDKQKGWYIYYWTFKVNRIRTLMKDLKKQRLEKLNDRLHREKDVHFFVCKGRCIRLNFDQATDYNYKCPECGSLMHQEDNQEKVAKIKEEIAQLEQELQVMAEEEK